MLTKDREAEIRKYVAHLPNYLRVNPQARRQTREGYERLRDLLAALDSERQTVTNLRKALGNVKKMLPSDDELSKERSALEVGIMQIYTYIATVLKETP